MGLTGIPRTAETIALAQMLLLIEQTGVRAHISQISCGRSLDMLRQARAGGLKITADTPLANLVYTDEAVAGYNSQFNVRPPLRWRSAPIIVRTKSPRKHRPSPTPNRA